MSVVDEDWGILLSLFPVEWEELGRKTGAIERLRGFDSVGNVLRTLLMHVGMGWSLRETAVRAKLAGIADVSDVTLLNRLRQSEGWLRELCQQLWKETGVDLAPAIAGYPVRLVDGCGCYRGRANRRSGGRGCHMTGTALLAVCVRFARARMPLRGRSGGLS